MGAHYFMQGGFTINRGQLSYDQWMFTLGYRFDSKGKTMSNDARRHQCLACALLLVCLFCGILAAPDCRAMISTTYWPVPAEQVSDSLEQFSDVKCTEQVTQEKLGKEDKVELKEESTYDYLVILTNAGGELSLDESRLRGA